MRHPENKKNTSHCQEAISAYARVDSHLTRALKPSEKGFKISTVSVNCCSKNVDLMHIQMKNLSKQMEIMRNQMEC